MPFCEPSKACQWAPVINNLQAGEGHYIQQLHHLWGQDRPGGRLTREVPRPVHEYTEAGAQVEGAHPRLHCGQPHRA